MTKRKRNTFFDFRFLRFCGKIRGGATKGKNPTLKGLNLSAILYFNGHFHNMATAGSSSEFNLIRKLLD